MSDTIIQIKRSTTTAAPTSLEAGELAFTSNGDTLWVGSPAGTNTANVIHIGSKISYFANSTQLGNTATGSNNELVTSYAIKGYVDGRFDSYSTTLAGLDDVTITTAANNNLLVYDAAAGMWENHTINGTSNEVEVTHSNHDITIGLPSAVTITTSLGVGSNVNLSTSSISVGNSTVNSSITSTAVNLDGVLNTGNTSVTGFANVSSTLQVGDLSSLANVNITGTANVSSALNVGANVNLTTSTISIGNSTVNTQLSSSSITTNVANVANLNSTTSLTVGSNVTVSTSALSIGNSTVNTGVNSTSVSTGSLTTSGLANLHSANVTNNVTIGGALNAGNTTVTGLLTVSGNLNVTGTLTTIDTQNIVIEDSLIRLARNQANTSTFTDAVDIGLYGVYGNTSSVKYTGIARDSSANAYVLFANKDTNPDNNGVSTTDTLSTLYAYLNSGSLISNTSTVAITANSTMNVAIVANTLTLSSALGVASGGTGRATLTTNAVLVGNSTGQVTELSSSTQGHVLQINGSGAPVFGGLDGGSF